MIYGVSESHLMHNWGMLWSWKTKVHNALGQTRESNVLEEYDGLCVWTASKNLMTSLISSFHTGVKQKVMIGGSEWTGSCLESRPGHTDNKTRSMFGQEGWIWLEERCGRKRRLFFILQTATIPSPIPPHPPHPPTQSVWAKYKQR